jgi:hypothetical protein
VLNVSGKFTAHANSGKLTWAYRGFVAALRIQLQKGRYFTLKSRQKQVIVKEFLG